MKLLLFSVIVVLIATKVFSFKQLTDKRIENKQAQIFIEYDLESKKLDYLILEQTRTILDLSRSRMEYLTETEILLEKIKSSKIRNTFEIESIFNTASLKDSLQYPSFSYTENKGLSSKHNRMIALSAACQAVITKLASTNRTIYKERPYLIGLKRRTDSMDLLIATALEEKFDDIQLAYGGDTIDVNTLPINIGPISGDVSFITDSSSDTKRCYRETF